MKNITLKRIDFLTFIINRLLLNGHLRKKHLIVYLLEYIRDYGVREFLAVSFRAVRAGGIKSILHPRQAILYRINNRGTGSLLPVSPAMVAEDLEALRTALPYFFCRPKISIILPVYNTSSRLLQAAIESVKKQIYENWELCIADDCSTAPGVGKLLDHYASDNRIRVTRLALNAGISEASNAAIRLSTGEYIALMDHDDEITPDALYWVVKDLNDRGDADILYSDECKIDEKGNLSDYFFKPDWSPELLFNMMYIGHLTVYRKKFLLDEVGSFRKEYDFSQDYDLILRATEKTARIRHLKKVLYHWRLTNGSASRGDKPYARKTNLAALDSAMRRRGIPAGIIELPAANRVKLTIDPTPGVSIIIPTDSFENLKWAVESIYSSTAYPRYEIIVVTNSGLIDEIRTHFNEISLVFVDYNLPYNFSDKCNQGAERARYEVLVFFNDDVRPLEADWIENTIEYLFIPGVGGVSPKLIYENDTIQYGGMATGVRNFVGTTFHKYHKDSVAFHNYPQLVRNVSILSGACLAIKKTLFREIGGFDPVNTPSAHSDIDISFKILEKGLRNVYTPYASLRHIGHLSLKEHEKKASGQKDKADIFILKKWMKYLSEDAFFPEPMKNFLYHDSPESFKLYGCPGKKDCLCKGNILVATHDLSLSGAPLNLYDLCKILKSNGYFVVVCAPAEGPLKDMYLEADIPVIVDALLLSQNDMVHRFARNFDFLICNTIVTWPIVKQMQDAVPTLWWLQEGQSIQAFTNDNDCIQTIREARIIIGLSDYALSYIREYNPNAIKIYNTCFDIYEPEPGGIKKSPGVGKLIVSLIGSIEKRKGQDILIKALEYLDEDLLEKLEIRLIGRYQDHHFAKKIKRMAGKINAVRFFGEVSRTQCQELIKETDVLVNASRDEPFSVALVEGFCLAKPCIMSEKTGIAELVTDGANGFIFRHEDAEHLAEKIHIALNNTDKLKAIGQEARNTYDKFLSVEKFERNILHLLNVKKIRVEYGDTTL